MKKEYWIIVLITLLVMSCCCSETDSEFNQPELERLVSKAYQEGYKVGLRHASNETVDTTVVIHSLVTTKGTFKFYITLGE